MIKKIAKGTFFIICLIAVLYLLNGITRFGYIPGENSFEEFYALEEDSVDVLFLGSSIMYFDTSPAVLWNDYGIASYDLGSAAQSLWLTYYYLKEALEYQNPKVIGVECYQLMEEDEYGSHTSQIKSLSGMKWSKNKWDAIQVSVPEEDRVEMILGFPSYHNRYSNLSKTDFLKFPWNVEQHYLKGAMSFQAGKKVYPNNELTDTQVIGTINPKVEEYYRKIIALAKENNSALFFYTMPRHYLSESDVALVNAAKKIAEENDVLFLEIYRKQEELGIDYSTDTVDGQHLNASGAEKVTKYLGEFLKSNYDIPDRTGEADYKSWELCGELWTHNILNNELEIIDNDSGYLELVSQMQKKNYTIVINVQGTAATSQMNELSRKAYTEMEISDVALMTEGTVIFSGGKILNYFLEDTYQEEMKLGKESELVITKTVDAKSVSIKLDGTEYNTDDEGISILVYDNLLQKYVDAAYFKANDNMRLNRIALPNEAAEDLW